MSSAAEQSWPETRPAGLDPTYSWAGSQHSLSRIRPLFLARSRDESRWETEHRHRMESLNAWNHRYWLRHNRLFEERRRQYVAQHTDSDDAQTELSPDQMAHFYQQFLEERRAELSSYHWTWYRRNFGLLGSATLAACSRFRRYLFRR